MKKLAYLLPTVALVFALGCTPKESPEDTPPPPQAPQGQVDQVSPGAGDVQEAAPAAPTEPDSAGKIVQDYATGLTTAPGKARAAQAKIDMAALQTAVGNFYAENERYPSSLDEVSGSMQAGFDMSPFNYNPATGKVSLK